MSTKTGNWDEEEQKLNIDIFHFIDILVGETESLTNAVAIRDRLPEFNEKISKLSKYPSFLKGHEINDHATVLHKAVSLFSFSSDERGLLQMHVFNELLNKYPILIESNRTGSDYFSGQTPLHIAICKQKPDVVINLLQAEKGFRGSLKKLLSQKANGQGFWNTVMMGELPLSIAALTGNQKIVEILLEEKVDICQQNSNHDNLCHSLLRYAHMYPEREDDALDMIKFIDEKANFYIDDERKGCNKKILSTININKETPLVLAAKYGQVEIFKYIMATAYSISDNDKSGGMFDVKLYDMTEIDGQLKIFAKQHEENEKHARLEEKNVKVVLSSDEEYEPSIFDLFFDLPYTYALKFMEIQPIKWMIVKKWRCYRRYLYIWWFIHTVIMAILTASAVERVTSTQEASVFNKGLRVQFPDITSAIFLGVSVLYLWVGGLFTVIIHVCRGKFRQSYKPFLNPYANASFKVLFSLFALCLIADFPLTWVEHYEHFLLLAAVVIGWYISLFFMRAHRFFCFFTSLIQRALVHDLAQFAPIILLQLLAFSTAMFMLLQGANSKGQENYGSWWKMLLVTFQSFLGLGEIPIFTAKQPVLLSIIYAIFIIMTTVLMLNGLIAILSSTCNDLITNYPKDMHLNLQRLSVILFFEGLLPNSITCNVAVKVTKKMKVFGYDRKRDIWRRMERYMIRIDTLIDDGANETSTTIRELIENMMQSRSIAPDNHKEKNTESDYGTVGVFSALKSTFTDDSKIFTAHVHDVRVIEIFNHNVTHD